MPRLTQGGERVRALVVMGTRPEGIKLAPVVAALAADPLFDTQVCTTAQHREMLDDVLDLFGIAPRYDLDVMVEGQDVYHVTTRVLTGMYRVLREVRPDWLIVQGDTTTTFAAALAGFYERVAVAHVEAGLRTGDPGDPFPEEMNRVLTSRLARLHFAPTPRARENLLREGCDPNAVVVTGNTVVDALRAVLDRTRETVFGELPQDGRAVLLVTVHRRENFGQGIHRIVAAVRELALRRPQVWVLWPVHPNPNIAGVVHQGLAGLPNVRLLSPLRYDVFANLLNRAALILSDSGGIQEEAASLGKRVLVVRRATERPEALEGGSARVVPAETRLLVEQAIAALDGTAEWPVRAGDWFGQGQAADRIRRALREDTLTQGLRSSRSPAQGPGGPAAGGQRGDHATRAGDE